MKKQLSVCIFFCVLFVSLVQPGWGQRYVWKKTFGNVLIHSPECIAVDAQGNMYLGQSDEIVKLDASGKLVFKFGSLGARNGQMNRPVGIALDSQGNIYVLDGGNIRVQKFDATGKFLLKFGTYGSSDGQFNNPQGIATDSRGNIYVADHHNSRIQKFDSNGKFISKLGTHGSADGQLLGPLSIALDSEDNLYVLEDINNRVQKFDATGKFLLKFGSLGSKGGQFYQPGGIAVDSQKNIYVVDGFNNRIQKFDATGKFLFQFGAYGLDDGQFRLPKNIAIDSQGNSYIVGTYENKLNNRIQKFNSSGRFVQAFSSPGTADGEVISPEDIAVDSQGNMYVVESTKNSVQKFDATGKFLLKFGSSGSANGQFTNPNGICVDGQGNIYVVDGGNSRVQKFDATGKFLTKFGTYGSANGQFSYPQGITLDSQGNMYIVDSGNSRIQKLDATGKFLFQFGAYGSANGQFKGAHYVALDSQGNVYVTDKENVQKFDATGKFLVKIGYYGLGHGDYGIPRGIKIDDQNNIYVSDRYINCFHKFNSAGTLVSKIAVPGIDNVALDKQGNVYTVSVEGIQLFAPNTPPTVAVTLPLLNSVYTDTNTLIFEAAASDLDGDIVKVEFIFNDSDPQPAKFSNGVYRITGLGWWFVPGKSYTIKARATDDLGGVTTTTPITIYVNIAPVVKLTAPVANTLFSNTSPITLKATATDTDGAIKRVEFFTGTNKLGDGTLVNGVYTFTWIAPIPQGSHILTVKATDDLNATTTSTPVTIHINAVPAVAITSHQNDQLLISPKTIELTATASDADGSVKNVAFFEGTTKLGDATLANGLYNFSWTAPTQLGDYTITAQVTDDKGASTTSSPVTLRIRDAITSTEAELRSKGIRIIPTSDLTGFTITSEKPLASVLVVDRLGRKMLSAKPASAVVEVETHHWAAGVYLVVMQLRSGERLVKRVVR